MERKVLTLIPDSIAPAVVNALQERLRLYQKRQPYREAIVRGTQTR